MKSIFSHCTLEGQVESKRKEMIRLMQHYLFISPEMIRVNQVLARLLNLKKSIIVKTNRYSIEIKRIVYSFYCILCICNLFR
ncbi:hypothetical protein CN324_16890 [Bacillus anthracis]|nr:hypothetical protein CN372_13745 [Bacillus anthracis]PFF19268.1 hypothetical protein CN324_16890 [Bacillus anthracis]PGX24232.1 hypothetical protein COE33_23455 [Bacillus anthracis]